MRKLKRLIQLGLRPFTDRSEMITRFLEPLLTLESMRVSYDPSSLQLEWNSIINGRKYTYRFQATEYTQPSSPCAFQMTISLGDEVCHTWPITYSGFDVVTISHRRYESRSIEFNAIMQVIRIFLEKRCYDAGSLLLQHRKR